jgi:DNA replication protein DnaC
MINACLKDIDYKSPRGIDRSVIMTLSSCDWIKKYNNAIITGTTGAGKIFLPCALANKACCDGYRTFYIRASKFY